MTSTLHATSIKLIEDAASHRQQSLIITGYEGIGLTEAANYFAEKLGGKLQFVRPVERKTGKIDEEKGIIGVDSIRELYENTRSKTKMPQIVAIVHAERMNQSAQGAFLKLLEEPRDNLFFILLTHYSSILLPTIRSRAHLLQLHPITIDQSNQLLDKYRVMDAKKRTQILFMASGLPEKIARLAEDDSYFAKQSSAMGDAKVLLQGAMYEKLVLIGRYKDDRIEAMALIDKATLILRQTISLQPTESLVSRLDRLLQTKASLEANGNVRLTLSKFVVY